MNGETLTSVDHYAEGPGEFTWWTILRMQARAAHNQTTERESILTQGAIIADGLARARAVRNAQIERRHNSTLRSMVKILNRERRVSGGPDEIYDDSLDIACGERHLKLSC